MVKVGTERVVDLQHEEFRCGMLLPGYDYRPEGWVLRLPHRQLAHCLFNI